MLSECSYYDPCGRCSKSLYKAAQLSGYFLRELTSRLAKSPLLAANEVTVSKSLGLLINISSLVKYEESRVGLTGDTLYSSFIKWQFQG